MRIAPAVFLVWAAAASCSFAPVYGQRLARRLPPEAVERAEARARHNAALRELFDAVGVPSGSDAASVAARAAALSAVVTAITNRAEVGSTGIRADAVASAVAALVSSTNKPLTHLPCDDSGGARE
jgi:hypothetical protein